MISVIVRGKDGWDGAGVIAEEKRRQVNVHKSVVVRGNDGCERCSRGASTLGQGKERQRGGDGSNILGGRTACANKVKIKSIESRRK